MSNQYLKLRRSSVPGKIPDTASLDFGEIALNTYDGLAYMKVTGSFGEKVISVGVTSGSFSGSLFGTASWANNAITASHAITSANVSGSKYYVAVFSGSSSIGTGSIYDSGSFTSIGAIASPHDDAPERLFVDASDTESYNLISGHGTINNYLQLNIKNFSSGDTGSSDIVATADNGDETSFFIDMGVNSSGYNSPDGIGGSNDAYLYSTAQDLLIGNASAGKRVIIFNGSGPALDNARVYINSQGTVGINASNPSLSNPEALLVEPLVSGSASPTDFNNLIVGRGTVNESYLQLNIINKGSGSAASADIVATNNTGDETSNYIDMGINSSGFNTPNAVGIANDAYLYSTGRHLHIGNASNYPIQFFVGGLDTDANRKLQLNVNGRHEVTGSLTATQGFSGSLYGTASWAQNAITASYVPASAVVGLNLSQITTGSITASVNIGQSSFNIASSSVNLLTSYNNGALNHGSSSFATGSWTHTEGIQTYASGAYSHAEGDSTAALGYASHTEGRLTEAYGNYSHAEGTSTDAIGISSHAEGRQTVSSGLHSHAEGGATIASGSHSHAEGHNTITLGEYSHTEGEYTEAWGFSSHAEGLESITFGDYSHAEGLGTYASGSYQHVQGQYNMTSSARSAFIIGNGSSNTNRSNLVFASGSTFQITGSLRVSGSITGSLFGTSSWAQNFLTSSVTSASFAQTASFGGNFTASNALINGTITAQTLVVQTITSSVVYSSGSNVFGNDLSNTQVFTGSVTVTGSLAVNGSSVVLSSQTGSMSVATASFALTASYVPASAVVGLNLSQISTGSISASVSLNSGSFELVSGSTSFLFVSNSGNIGVGTTTPRAKVEVNGDFRIGGSFLGSSNGPKSFIIDRYSNNAFADEFTFRKARGTAESPTTTVSQDQMGGVEFYGYDGTNFIQSAMIYTNIDGPVSTNSVPGRISFYVNNGTGSTVNNEVVRITSTGNVGIGTTSPSHSLDVSGSVRIKGAGTTASTIALNVQNNAGTSHLQVLDNGSVYIPGNAVLYLNTIAGYATDRVAMPRTIIGSGVSAMDASAALQIISTTQGIIPTKTGLTSNIVSPAQGLITYITSSLTEGLWYYSTGLTTGWTRFLNDTGSQVISGSLTVTQGITGSLFGTASWALNALTASYVLNAVSASYAATASYISASNVVGLSLSQITLGAVTASVNAGSNLFNIISGSNTLVVVDNTGSVGIGTTSPAYKLDVNGTARFTSQVNFPNSSVVYGNGYFSAPGYGLVDNTALLSSGLRFGSDRAIEWTTGFYYHVSSVDIALRRTNENYLQIDSGTSTNYRGLLLKDFKTSGLIIAESGSARGGLISSSLSASANNDVLVGLDINPTFNNGAFTGTTNTGLRIKVPTLSNSLQILSSTNTSLFTILANEASGYVDLAGQGNTMRLNSGGSGFTFYAVINSNNGATFKGYAAGGGIPIAINAFSGQSVNLFNVNSSTGTGDIFSIRGNGNTTIGNISDLGYKVQINGSGSASGSLFVSGSSVMSGSLSVTQGITGSLFGTASWATNFVTSSVTSASYAQTASAASNFVVGNSLTASNALITGTITAQTLVVQTITASVEYSSGSNIFGSQLSNTQQFTGSVSVTGSLSVNGSTVPTGTGSAGQVAVYSTTNTLSGSNNLFWDSANARLGIGNNTPTSPLFLYTNTSSTTVGDNSGFILHNNNPSQTVENLTELFFSDAGQATGTAGGLNLLHRYAGISGFVTTWNFGSSGGGLNFVTKATTVASLTTKLQVRPNGNVIIQDGGTFTDGGQRLQVYGDAFIKGSGATSATNALLVQNSAGTELVKVDNSGQAIFSNRIAVNRIQALTSADAIDIVGGIGSASGGNGMYLGQWTTGTNTSGQYIKITSGGTFAPTSGTGTYTNFIVNNVINQTGGANGITRGLYVNPTLTAAADWRSIEWSNNTGFGLYGAGTANNYLGGSLGIGTTSPSEVLQIKGNLRVQTIAAPDSAGTASIILNPEANTPATIQALSNFGPTSGTNYSTGFKFITRNRDASLANPYYDIDAMSILANGNVGIGTTTDTSAKLHISGSTGALLRVSSNASSNILFVSSSGNIGIGTTSPNARLDVSGSAIISGSLTVTQGITGSLFGTASWAENALTASFIPTSSLVGNFFAQGGNSFGATALLGTNDSQSLAFETSGSVRMFISGSGNVGIGTNTPQSTLHVGGNLSVISTINTGTIYFGSGSVYGPSGTSPLYMRHDSGRWYFTGLSNEELTIDLNPSSISTFTLSEGDIYFNANQSGKNILLQTQAATKLFISSSGNVGIGTTAPNASLHISSSTSSNLLKIDTPTQNNLLLVSSSGVVTIGMAGSAYGSTGTSNGKLTINNNSGNNGLAIRNGESGYQVAIKATTNDSIGTEFVWYDGNTATFLQYGGSIGARLGTSGIAQFRSNNADSSATIHTGASTSERLRVTSTGLVGISTTSPAYTLDVSGSARVGDSNYYLTLTNGGSDGGILRVGGSSYGYAELKSYALTLNGGHAMYGTGGSSGFGFNSQVAPGATQGAASAAMLFTADNSGSGGGIWAAYPTALAFNFRKKETSGLYTSLLVLNGNTNNVGIGTITPNAKLDVSGSAIISGSITATQGITGSLFGTSSWATNFLTSSVTSASYAGTASVLLGSVESASYAATASWALNFITSSVTSASFASTASYFLTSSVTSASFASTASYGNNGFIIGASQFNNTSSITVAGTTTISQLATGSYISAFYNYAIISASNARSGQIMSIWSGSTVKYTEVTTTDIGNTSTASFAVALSGNNVQLNFTAPGVWTVKNISNLL